MKQSDFNDEVATEPAFHGYNGSMANFLFQDEVKCAASTGINVLIIGAGVGGLSTALECVRKGHSVKIFERSEKASVGGDMFTIGASGLRLLDNYPGMLREYDESVSIHNLWMRYCKWTGEQLGDTFPFAKGAKGAEQYKHANRPPMTTALRPLFHAMLYHQLERFGIKVQFGMNVRDFYEDAERGVGGVVIEDGSKFEADLVIAADGLHSKSRDLIPTTVEDAQPTGRTVFRCAMPLDIIEADPILNEAFGLEGEDPRMQVWLGPETHSVILAYVDKNGMNGRLCFGLAFREPEGTLRKESWNDVVSSEEVLSIIERLPGWSPSMKRLMEAVPPGNLIAWPLNPRNPNPRWHSPAARVLQLGDAAHSFLPTSGNGATQAIEDAITIAACLSHVGKRQITTAVKAHNLLRFDRVSCCQLLGFANAARFQKTDFEKVGQDPSKVQPKLPKWIWGLDVEGYANDNYAKAAASLVPDGPVFKNTNIPPGFTPKPWTIDEIEKRQKEGKAVELEGDWS
ncbi:FAD-dependent monooxygenase fsr3 [Pseudocercospora fuligena]|uniref:FAD-dependent monooxygenase fsr3 n=1 Tax=Pseudocercospora fuligena TaxID=685502 RepID=A0A8H6VM91_9PEZI|nr:FAD-dependent monooxygenase fsr3 [Pseudocercospora fuligena]